MSSSNDYQSTTLTACFNNDNDPSVAYPGFLLYTRVVNFPEI